MTSVADTVERRDAVVATNNGLPIDEAWPGAQTSQRLDDERKAPSQVMARTAVEPHPPIDLAGNDVEAIVPDFVQPLAAGRQCCGFVGRHGPMNPAGRVRCNIPHMLRHGWGYALANAGHDTRRLQAYLGHKNIQHTMRYAELAPDRFKNFWRWTGADRAEGRRRRSVRSGRTQLARR
jgi:hypothetical protein